MTKAAKLVKHAGRWMTTTERDRLLEATGEAPKVLPGTWRRKDQQAPAPKAPPRDAASSQPTAAGAPEPPAPEAADPAEVAAHCVANGQPQMAAELIRARVPMAEVRRLVDGASAIRQSFHMTRQINSMIPDALLDDMLSGLAQGITSVDFARKTFVNWLADNQSPEILGAPSISHLSARYTEDGGRAGNHGWDAAIARSKK